jgi:serine/threonine protein kinase
VITEFAEGGDLSALIQDHKKRSVAVKEETIWKTAGEILLALTELHRLNIFHRDIKSANVMLAGGKAKLGDLNVSKISKTGLASTQTGTPFYASP